jgi:mediator of RNA polymerase II transcription subunit 7
MMQDQLDRSRAETEGIMKMKREVEGILEGLGKIGLGEGSLGSVKKDEVLVEEGEDVWAELDREFG